MPLSVVSEQPATFDDFWKPWPNKVGKKDARKAWADAMQEGHEPRAIVAGIEPYKRNKPDWKAWLHPGTYIRGERWEDEYQPDGAVAAVREMFSGSG